MIQYIRVGWCSHCSSPRYVPSFIEGPVRFLCKCEEVDKVDQGIAFDQLVLNAQLHFLHQEQSPSFELLLLATSADLGAAQMAFLDGDRKAALAFLVKVAGRIRYGVADRPELQSYLDKFEVDDE